MTNYEDLGSLVPLFGGSGSGSAAPFVMGRVTSWDTTTFANAVDVLGALYTNLPVLANATLNVSVNENVILARWGKSYIIVDSVFQPPL